MNHSNFSITVGSSIAYPQRMMNMRKHWLRILPLFDIILYFIAWSVRWKIGMFPLKQFLIIYISPINNHIWYFLLICKNFNSSIINFSPRQRNALVYLANHLKNIPIDKSIIFSESKWFFEYRIAILIMVNKLTIVVVHILFHT